MFRLKTKAEIMYWWNVKGNSSSSEMGFADWLGLYAVSTLTGLITLLLIVR